MVLSFLDSCFLLFSFFSSGGGGNLGWAEGKAKENPGHSAVGHNQWYHFEVGAPPNLVFFSGDWDVHWGYELLTHGHSGF